MSGRLIFLGTASICLPFLEALKKAFDLSLIISQPDRPSGRNRTICFSCVKTFALENRIPFLQPNSLADENIVGQIHSLSPDIAVVIAYGQWIPPSIFKIPRFRTINVHFSLLPSYRGAAPVQRAIQDGRSETGVSIFELSSRMDAGPIWRQFPMAIHHQDTTATLWERMSAEAAPFLVDTIGDILSGSSRPVPQDDRKASLAPLIRKEEGLIDWKMPAFAIRNLLRAFTPWPGIFFPLNNRQIKVVEADAIHFRHHCQPGTIHRLDQESMQVCCGDDSLLRISSLQPPGKKPMSPYCYSRGNPIGLCLE